MFPTVADVLALPAMRSGNPELIAGSAGLSNPVRWVHVSELADIAHLLSGGELLLTTGIALPEGRDQIVEYVKSLQIVGVSGLVIELGRKFDSAPAPLQEAAEALSLPLIVLHREVQFVKITEAAHGLIINSQLDELKRRAEIHQSFTEMTLEGASTLDVVRQAGRILRRPVVLENLRHHVLAYEPGDEDLESLLADWESRSRRASGSGRRQIIAGNPSWLVTMVGARGEMWARLIAVSDGRPPTELMWAVLERAAGAIALNRLIERDRESLERQSHGSLLADILSGAYGSEAEVESRSTALGVPLAKRNLVGCVLKVYGTTDLDSLKKEARRRNHLERVVTASRDARVKCLVGTLPSGSIGLLVSLSRSGAIANGEESLSRLAQAIHNSLQNQPDMGRVVVAAGSSVSSLHDVRRSFLEADQVAEAAEEQGQKLLYRLPDVRLTGVLHLLRDDARVQAFIERELGVLLAYDERRKSGLLPVLEAYLNSGRNKSAGAALLGMSRPTFYHRLQEVESVLGVDLSVESCLSLHVALIGSRLVASQIR